MCYYIMGCSFSSCEGNYKNFNIVLQKINYTAPDWILCFKSCLLVSWSTKRINKVFMFYMWANRARNQHWPKKQRPVRKTLTLDKNKIWNKTLVDTKKILPPPIHTTLGITKQFVKALPEDGDSFKYLCNNVLIYQQLNGNREFLLCLICINWCSKE